jgi:hypothetical protein
MQALPPISDAINELHTREIPVEYDILLSIGAGRPDKERRPVDHCRCFQICEQFGGIVWEFSKADT